MKTGEKMSSRVGGQPTRKEFGQKTVLDTGFVFLLAIIAWASAIGAENIELSSPDGRMSFHFRLDEAAPVYRVSFEGQPIVAQSRLGFAVKDGAPLDCGFRVIDTRKSSHDET